MIRRALLLVTVVTTLLFAAGSAAAQAAAKVKKPSSAKSSAVEPSPAMQEAVIAAHRKQLLSKINTPPLAAFHPQLPKRIELPNGMVIFLQEDHELPLIDGS